MQACWAYFDETIVSQTEMLLGGCIASQTAWDGFKVDWREALRSEGIGTFHATDFYSFHGEFKWFLPTGERDNHRHSLFRDRLVDIIVTYVDEAIAFTSMVRIPEKGVRGAYRDAVKRSLHEMIKRQCAFNDLIYVVLARHPELSPWSVLKIFEQMNWEKRLAGCGIFDARDIPALQAADFVLHSVNKRWEGAETPSFNRLKNGFGRNNKRFSMQIASTADLGEP
jgi:hypothetical protein